jgi:hypothetical protein
MNERPPLLELLRALAAAGLIDGKIFVRGDLGDEIQAPDVHEPPRRRHLVSA